MSLLPYLAPHTLALLVELVIMTWALRRSKVRGAKGFVLAVGGQAWWTFGYVCEVLSPTLSGKLLWDDLQFLGSVGWCVGFYLFAVSYTQPKLANLRAIWWLHGAVLGGYLALVFSDSHHHLIRPDARLEWSGDLDALVYSFTTATYAASVYFIATFALALWLFARHALRSPPPYRTQSLLIVAGTLLPVFGTVLTVAGAFPAAYRDVTPLTFAAGDALIAWSLFRHRLLDLVPVARDVVFDNLRDVVVVVDVERRVIDGNRALLSLLERPASEVIGKAENDVFARWPELIERFAPLNEGHAELAVDVHGEPRHVALEIAPLRDDSGNLLGRVIVSHDVTELARAKAALEATNSELSVTNRELDSFTYSISHDLRAPLRTMSAFAKRLLDLHGHELSPDARELAERMMANAERMRELTEALLGFARLGRQPLRKQSLNLGELAGAVWQEVSSEAAGRKLDFQLAELPEVQGDPALLRQVLANLLRNAVKFTRNKAQASIEVGVRRDEHPNVFYVKDDGAGFDMEYAERLFGVFQRMHDASEFEGTGVGLAVAKNIVERHGGRIWAESQVDRGATFFFTLG